MGIKGGYIRCSPRAPGAQAESSQSLIRPGPPALPEIGRQTISGRSPRCSPFLGHPTTAPSTQPGSPFHVSASSSSHPNSQPHQPPTCCCTPAAPGNPKPPLTSPTHHHAPRVPRARWSHSTWTKGHGFIARVPVGAQAPLRYKYAPLPLLLFFFPIYLRGRNPLASRFARPCLPLGPRFRCLASRARSLSSLFAGALGLDLAGASRRRPAADS